MFTDKMKLYSKLIIIFVVALLISGVSMNEVFISGNPTVRPHLKEYLIAKLKSVSNPDNLIASLFGPKEKSQDQIVKEGFDNLQKVAFTQIAPGISARASEHFSETSYDVGGIKWIKHKIVVNGVEHTFGWPEGKPLPSDAMLQSMFQ